MSSIQIPINKIVKIIVALLWKPLVGLTLKKYFETPAKNAAKMLRAIHIQN